MEIAPDLSALSALADWAESVCQTHAVPTGSIYTVQLCLEEAVSNTIRHAQLAADARISIRLRRDGDRLVVEVTDPGIAFDPVKAPNPPPLTSLEDAVVGGRGIDLMRHACEAMQYERRDGRNHLLLTIRLPESGAIG